MAHTKLLDEKILSIVRSQIGQMIANYEPGLGASEEIGVGESFEVYILPASEIAQASQTAGGLLKALQRTGDWHHQISVRGASSAFARSGVIGPVDQEWSVQSLFISDIAAKIDAAVAQIDSEHAHDDAEVLFVAVPAYHVHAFVVEHSGKPNVLVVDSPYKAPGPEEKTLYSEAAFLASLLAVPHIQGLASE